MALECAGENPRVFIKFSLQKIELWHKISLRLFSNNLAENEVFRPEINWLFLHFVQLACISNYTQLSFKFIPILLIAADQMCLSFKHISLPSTAQKALRMLLCRCCMIFKGAQAGTYRPERFGSSTYLSTCEVQTVPDVVRQAEQNQPCPKAKQNLVSICLIIWFRFR